VALRDQEQDIRPQRVRLELRDKATRFLDLKDRLRRDLAIYRLAQPDL